MLASALKNLEGKKVLVRINTKNLSIQVEGTLNHIYGHDIYTVHQGRVWSNFNLSQVYMVSEEDNIIGLSIAG